MLTKSIGIAFCSIVRHVGFSVSITNSVLGIFTVMSGIMSSAMPVFLDRINRISPVPYLARVMAVNEFPSTVKFTCTSAEVSAHTCFYQNGSDVLRLLVSSPDLMQFDASQFALYFAVGIALTAAYRAIAFFILASQCISLSTFAANVFRKRTLSQVP
jgi:hypothetical protein